MINNGNMCMVVKWSDDHAFATNGDCGSVYFFRHEGRVYPLAVHIGSGRYTTDCEKASIGACLCGFTGRLNNQEVRLFCNMMSITNCDMPHYNTDHDRFVGEHAFIEQDNIFA